MNNVVREGAGPDGTYLEQRQSEIVREMYRTIHSASLDKFTFTRVDSLWMDLRGVVRALEDVPEAAFKELIEVVMGLREARNELGLACFLFDLEEMNSVHRLVLRNKAVLRSKPLLQKALEAWPLHTS